MELWAPGPSAWPAPAAGCPPPLSVSIGSYSESEVCAVSKITEGSLPGDWEGSLSQNRFMLSFGM